MGRQLLGQAPARLADDEPASEDADHGGSNGGNDDSAAHASILLFAFNTNNKKLLSPEESTGSHPWRADLGPSWGMLTVTSLSKRYGENQAAADVSFTVPPGRIVGFLGPNGAGKTTTMRSIFGLVEPDSGSVTWDGAPVDQARLMRFGYLPEQRGLYPKMRIGQQVAFFAQLKGLGAGPARDAANRLLGELGLGDRLDDTLEKLSHGNQQRVQLAVAMVHDPDLLVLDEPFSGLDPVAVSVLQAALQARAAAGAGVLFSSHQLDLVERICEEVVIIANGRVKANGPIDEVRNSVDRRVVDVRVDDNANTLASALEGFDVIDLGNGQATIRIASADELDAVLGAARSAGTITTFSYQPPTLSEVFAEVVA